MFTTIADFLETWRHESAKTAHLLAELTDESLECRIAEGYRSLGDLAWHIVVARREIAGKLGIRFDGPAKGAPVPASASEIQSDYVDSAKALAAVVEREVTDADLAADVAFYGQHEPLGAALMILFLHEVHHRGQLTVLMRQAGLRVPGVYGPSKDG